MNCASCRSLRFAMLLASVPLAFPSRAVAQDPAAAPAAAMVPLAILPFQDRAGAQAAQPSGDAAKVTDLLFAELVAEPTLMLIEREDIRKLLDEQELNLSGIANPAEATRVGQLTGAKLLVTGSVLRVDNSLYLVAKVIGTETSRVLGASVKGGVRDDLGKLTDSLADEIVKVVAARGGVAHAMSPDVPHGHPAPGVTLAGKAGSIGTRKPSPGSSFRPLLPPRCRQRRRRSRSCRLSSPSTCHGTLGKPRGCWNSCRWP